MSIIISRDGVLMEVDDSYLDDGQIEDDGSFARVKRDDILVKDVDPIAFNSLLWADLTSEKQAEWKQYRTDLLNVPQQAGFPTDITWPTKPE